MNIWDVLIASSDGERTLEDFDIKEATDALKALTSLRTKEKISQGQFDSAYNAIQGHIDEITTPEPKADTITMFSYGPLRSLDDMDQMVRGVLENTDGVDLEKIDYYKGDNKVLLALHISYTDEGKFDKALDIIKNFSSID